MKNIISVNKYGKILIDGIETNFYVHEFVCPELFHRFKFLAIRFIDPRIVIATQYIRNETGLSTTVNNYIFSGTYKDSGTRILASYIRMKGKLRGERAYLNTNSMHKYACAGDLKVKGWSSHEMVKFVMDREKIFMNIGIWRIENPDFTASKHGKLGTDWMHMDSGNEGNDYIRIVNP